MKILPIEKITGKEKQELKKLNRKERKTGLNKAESCRQFFLDIKQFWNCEC